MPTVNLKGIIMDRKWFEQERYKKYLKEKELKKIENQKEVDRKKRLRKILDKICPNKYDQEF